MDIFQMYSKEEILDYIHEVFPKEEPDVVYRLIRAFHVGTTLDKLDPRLFTGYFVLGMLLPFDRLPLFINDSSWVLQRVILLRLQRGR